MSGFRWILYLKFAEAYLAKYPDKELFQRLAVSRAYYAAFNLSRSWLERHDYTIGSHDSSHKQVWNSFTNAVRADDETKSDWQLVGSLGHSLKSLRVDADYDRLANLEQRAPRGVAIGKQIVEDLLPKLKTK